MLFDETEGSVFYSHPLEKAFVFSRVYEVKRGKVREGTRGFWTCFTWFQKGEDWSPSATCVAPRVAGVGVNCKMEFAGHGEFQLFV